MSGSTRGKIIEVLFHRDALLRFLRHLKTDSRTESEIRTMIEAEASEAFIANFYGLSHTEYYRYRLRAGLLRSTGRPIQPDRATVAEIQGLLDKFDLMKRSPQVGPFDFLAVYQLTGYSLPEIWWVYCRLSTKSSTMDAQVSA